jgi:hypothetical protein
VNWNNPELLLIPSTRIYLDPVFIKTVALEFRFAKIRDAGTALVRWNRRTAFSTMAATGVRVGR